MPGFHQRFVGLAELPRSIPQFDVDESFQLGQHDIDEVRYQFKASRLGAALQLVVIKAAGRSPKKFTGIPRTLLRSLCVSVKLNATAILTAFDIADKAVAKSRAMAERHEVVERFQVRIADVDGYDWPIDALDGVASIFVRFADRPLLERMFPRITAALKPVGTLTLRCCRATTPEQVGRGTGGPLKASDIYTEAIYRFAFSDLELVEMRAYEDDFDEGLGHPGRSALIDLCESCASSRCSASRPFATPEFCSPA